MCCLASFVVIFRGLPSSHSYFSIFVDSVDFETDIIRFFFSSDLYRSEEVGGRFLDHIDWEERSKFVRFLYP